MINNILRKIHPREFLERKAYDRLVDIKADTANDVSLLVDHGSSSLEIATALGGRKILLGILVLLAAYHIKKTSPP